MTSLDDLTDDLLSMTGDPLRRILVGITGIPGAGKSTFAAALLHHINQKHGDIARLVPMDGFHFPNHHLDALGLRQVKGAPQTFDALAYVDLLIRLRHVTAESHPFPIYDRTTHEPRLTGEPQHTVEPHHRIILTEGNNLLLDREPWCRVHDLLDACWFLDTPIDLARRRLLDRHVRGGKSPEQALTHYERTDGPNTHGVLACRSRADRWIQG